MCVCVNSTGCSPPLLPTYPLSFIFHIPPSWHLLLCRVLHGWQIEFTQIKQSLCGAVSWEMMHVEEEGISIQISHTHMSYHIIADIPAPLWACWVSFFCMFFHLLPTLPVVFTVSATSAEPLRSSGILSPFTMHTKNIVVMWLNDHSILLIVKFYWDYNEYSIYFKGNIVFLT